MTVTIMIGNSDDKLTQEQWAKFVAEVDVLVKAMEYSRYFFGTPSACSRYQNACWVVGVTGSSETYLRDRLAHIAEVYSQDSVAWIAGETEFIQGVR